VLNSVIDDIARAQERRRLERLQAMLDMFEEDRGRPAANTEELRDWMGAQYLDELHVRMKCRLNAQPQA
jgi:hypothetical protein